VTINPLENPYGTAFGLMDEVYGPGTEKALQECGGPWECFTVVNGRKWKLLGLGFTWLDFHVYRKKPAPPKPLWPEEVWVNVEADGYHQMHYTKEEADFDASKDRITCIRYVLAPEETE
jgi:hypothetical protein